MVNSKRDVFRSVFLLATVAALVSAVAGFADHRRIRPRGDRAVTKLKQALAYAQQTTGDGYPLFGKNPYRKVLRVLRTYGTKIPPLWRSRALARYASFLLHFGNYSYKSNKVPEKYLDKAKALLHEAVKLSPKYAGGWIRLAYLECYLRGGSWRHLHSLRLAARLDPHNPLVQAARAWEIVLMPGAVHVIPGKPLDPPGNFGFVSAKWRRAFCYRALLYLKYHNERYEFRVAYVSLDAAVFRSALKFYEPKQLAALEAGKWKPDPAADPWPPKPKPLAKKDTAPAGGGQKKE
jgi:hypothetical protein